MASNDAPRVGLPILERVGAKPPTSVRRREMLSKQLVGPGGFRLAFDLSKITPFDLLKRLFRGLS